MATSPTNAGTEPEPRKSFRDRPLGRIAILLAVFLVAFIAAKTCASNDTKVDQDEAVEIAKEQVDFEPTKVLVRFVQRVGMNPAWAVSLTTVDAAGVRRDCATVLVDGETGNAKTEAC